MSGYNCSSVQPIYYRIYLLKNRVVNVFDPPVLVLIYHRVTTLASDPQLLAVTPDNFLAQVKYLKEHFPVVRFEDNWSKLKKPAVVITFDDGYADNALEALPILEETEVPATFFISTGTIGTRQELWWDELEHILLENGNFSEHFILDDHRFGKVWPTGTVSERHALYDEIHPLMKNIDARRRENWLKQLRQWSGAEKGFSEAHRAMTVEELRRLARSRWVTIGAHTINHTALSSLPVSAQKEEIMGSRMHLESWLEREITVFSYPFGTKSDYTHESVELCKEAGFVKVAANSPGQAHSWTDPFHIPRQLVRNWPVEVFAEKIKRFWIS